MRRTIVKLISLAGLVAALDVLGAAETGDFDGDGLLTIRDMRDIFVPIDGEPDPAVVIAEGSLDRFQEYPCASWEGGSLTRSGWWPASVYLEILERSVPGGLAPYSPMHWVDEWAEVGWQPPLAADRRFTVRVGRLQHRWSTDLDEVEVEVEVSLEAPVSAFSLLLETDGGLLRVPWLRRSDEDGAGFNAAVYWAIIWGIIRDPLHAAGDIAVGVPVIGYLVTEGRYVVAHGLRGWSQRTGPPEPIPAGEYRILTRGRLPWGTEPGEYRLDLHETSQVLFADGTVAAPWIEEQGAIVVEERVQSGWDEGVVPLRLDELDREVLGEVRFRLADENGNPLAPGEPVARGEPGEHVRFRVQVRTETPLNYIHFELRGPESLLTCGGEPEPLLEDFEVGGEPLVMARFDPPCNPLIARYEGWFMIGANQSGGLEKTSYPDRAWEYFKPLGEWLDLMEFDLVISETAEGDIPLVFHRPDPSDPSEHAPSQGDVEFLPYLSRQFCFDWRNDPQYPSPNWKYTVVYEDGFIGVDEPSEPPPRPDLGIRFELGEVEGFPGDLVEVPVVLSWREPAAVVTLVLEMDPEAAVVVEAVDTSVLARGTDDDVREVRDITRRGEVTWYRECLPESECTPGGEERCCWLGEQYTWFRDTEERFAAIDWTGFGVRVGHDPLEIARLRVRIREDADVNLAVLRPAVVTVIDQNGFETPLESGGQGSLSGDLRFSPAEVTPGRVWLLGRGRRFRRGDSNEDGALNLTDAVRTLMYLFRGGGPLSCPDAADANDDGEVNLTDAIFFLRSIFAGQGVIPEPAGGCGYDPTDDELRCEEGACA